MFNGLMVIPNIIAVIGLYKLVGRALTDYREKYIKGEKPMFGPSEQLTGKLAALAKTRVRHAKRHAK